MYRFSAAASAAALFLVAGASSAVAEPTPDGRWDRVDGLGGIVISHCGSAYCGKIVWLRDSNTPAHIGQRVLFDMRPSGDNSWSGSAINPEDGRTYSGVMTLEGSRLVTKGCALGGLVCQTVALTRSR